MFAWKRTRSGKVVYDRKPKAFLWRDAARIIAKLDPPEYFDENFLNEYLSMLASGSMILAKQLQIGAEAAAELFLAGNVKKAVFQTFLGDVIKTVSQFYRDVVEVVAPQRVAGKASFFQVFWCGIMPIPYEDEDPEDFELRLFAWKRCMGYTKKDQEVTGESLEETLEDFRAEIRSIVEG